MRRIEYKRPVKRWLGLLALTGCALTLVPLSIWPGMIYVSWGLIYLVVFESLGFVCIHVSELENDIEVIEKREVGNWSTLITDLSLLRGNHPELFEAGLELQKLNRYFWREFQRSRRSVLRTHTALNTGFDPQLEPQLEACNALAREWFERMQDKLRGGSVEVTENDRAYLSAIKAIRTKL